MGAYGFLLPVHPVAVVVGILLAIVVLGYLGAPLLVWTAAAAVVLWGLSPPAWVWVAWGVPALVFDVRPLRRFLVSKPLMKTLGAMGVLPSIGPTERIALEAGTVWIEGEFFTGRPDLDRILGEAWPELTDAERAFLDGPVEELCRMASDWEIRRREDLSPEVWDFLRRERFLGMAIPEAYGGLGFSAYGMRCAIAKIGSRSVPLAVDVMVPNSLGPAELLVHYGTDAQKERWLPGLARGEEIPCFALTEPDAGSDAASIESHGTVFRDDDGELRIRLEWEKRYITLAAVATVLGLAFRLHDPGNLLGKGEEPGITCALVPTDLDGVVLGRRHDPLRTPFINAPTEGRGVVVPIDAIIGGADEAGNGWRMLMETLAGGRGIFLPALNTGGDKLAARVAGAYARVRRQFGLPVGKFEGVVEHLAPIGGLTWTLDALSRLLCGGLVEGAKPAVSSAIAKYQASEFNRTILNHAMDVLGGKGIVLGPNNLLGYDYIAAPIAITVEGSNVITRSLIIFGQGLIRCHPYALAELTALTDGDADAFDRSLWAHVGSMVRNLFRAKLLYLTRGRLARAPVGGPGAGYWRRLAWASATFALLADLALVTLGGALKKKETLSGRFADALSWMVLLACALRKFEARGRPEAERPFLEWSARTALAEIQAAFLGIVRNFPVPVLGAVLAGPVAAWLRLNPVGSPPDDRTAGAVAGAIQEPGAARDALTEGMFVPGTEAEGEPLADLERALRLAVEGEPLRRKVHDGGELDDAERALVAKADAARDRVVAVDAFDLDTLPTSLPAAGPAAVRA